MIIIMIDSSEKCECKLAFKFQSLPVIEKCGVHFMAIKVNIIIYLIINSILLVIITTLMCYHHDQSIYHWCGFFFLFTGWEPTMWPANNCLQVIVCSCSVSSDCVWLQIIFCSCINETALFSFFASLLLENGKSLCFSKKFIKKHKLSDWTIKKLLNSSYHKKYLDLSVCLADQLFAEAEGSIMIFWSTSSKNNCLIFSSHFNL